MPVHQEINPRKITPAQRARICEAIRRELAIETLSGKTARREFWARVSIGLPPRPRPFHWEVYR
jgi:hypothetical protein